MEEIIAGIMTDLRSKLNRAFFQLFDTDRIAQDLREMISRGMDDSVTLEYVSLLSRAVKDITVDHRRAQDFKGPKVFLGSDIDGLVLEAEEYLNASWYSNLAEHLFVAAFIGHEFETFNYESSKQILSSLYRVVTNTQFIRLEAMYKAILSSHCSATYLRERVTMAESSKCHVNPLVPVLLDRTIGRGITEFKSRAS